MVTMSPTAALRARAALLRREGTKVFDFSAGELELATPGHIVEAATAATTRPESHHYGPTAGEEALRQAIAERLSRRTPRAVTAPEVAVTNGAKQALFNTFMTLLEAGDEVLIPAPYWVTFPSSVQLANGVPVTVNPAPGALKVSVDDFAAALTPATRAILICSPNNPTGLVFDEQELRAILGWAADHGLWVVADETYVDLAFRPVPAPALVEERLTNRLITAGSVSKSFAMTGWRVGWMSGPKEIVDAAIAVQSHTTSNVNRTSQAAALAALTGPDVTVHFRELLRGRLEVCRSVLEPLSLFQTPPDGGFFIFANVQRYGDDVTVADRLLDGGVVVVPGTSFGTPGHIRMSFAIGEDDLRNGLERMSAIFDSWPDR